MKSGIEELRDVCIILLLVLGDFSCHGTVCCKLSDFCFITCLFFLRLAF